MATLVIPQLEISEGPWPTLGPQVCALLEERAVHGPGDLRGVDYRLDDEKRALIYRWYEVYPKGHPRAGRRRFKRAGLSVRKGTAKTELAAAIAFVELHPDGPVRCDGFDANGDPVGVPVTDPYIPMVAYTGEQTGDLAYAALLVMVTEGYDPDLFDAGVERVMRADGDGKAVALAAAPDSRDGARTTFQHFDETHRFTSPRLREAHQTMLANIPKRQLADPWSLETTTTYTPGQGSVAEGTHEYAELIDQGKAQDRTLFFFHREAAPREDEDLSDPEQIRDAVREASGPAIASWPDFEGQVDAIVSLYNQPDTDRSYWERVWLNRRVQARRQAFDLARWNELARSGERISDGRLVTAGFDGARYVDSTGIVLTDVETGHQVLFAGWEADGTDEWEVPDVEVHEAWDEIFSRWNVWRAYLDPPYWENEVSHWQGKYGAQRMVKWATYRRRQAAFMVRQYHRAMQSGALTHDGNEGLRRHIANARRHELSLLDEDGRPLWMIRKARHDSPFKIDFAMAGALSWEARSDAVASGVVNKRRRYVYTA